ncbi:methylmalonyl-CoA mutase family protein [Neolewinella antarctica]|uniref:Methylmalonyl-CoA mutase n=1 Tax=Neolewinella antarctica TaxID=442734 RepID=A0ABX0X942_9BACT|nr:methylmalonyl-CoA mutase family protein [Neolewinella antarctica]NJC25786.1 methylmalonyl-CoA mutase [Neolewinella antarctica]
MNASSPPTLDWTEPLQTLLADRSLTDLDRLVAEQLTQGGGERRAAPDWLIGAYVDEGSYGEINRYAKAEIERGAEALLFRLYRQPDATTINRILKDIDASTTGLHCSLRYPGQDPAELFRDLVRYLRQHGYDLSKVVGSVDFDPLLDWSEPPFPPLVRLLRFVAKWMPGFTVLQVNAAGFNNGTDLADTEIALSLAKAVAYLKTLEAAGYPARQACGHLKFALSVGTSFHGDVAKLRAIRRLWTTVLKEEFGVTTTEDKVLISAHTDVTTLTNDWAENRKRLSLHAHAMIQGGANLVFLTPLEQVDDSPTVRARNHATDVQKELRKEYTSLAQERDLKTITDRLSEAAYDNYQHLVEQGGFATAVDL